LRGAIIEVLHSAGHTVTQGITDPFGTYLTAVPTGSYTVTAQANGYHGSAETVHIQHGRQTIIGPVSLRPREDMELPGVGLWRIDPSHSSIRFVARHLALSRIYGSFSEFNGTIKTGTRMEDALINVSIDATSLTTANKMRDDHLKSADFLDVQRNPTIEFNSSKITRLDGDQWWVNGTLNLHGTIDDIRLDASYLGIRNWDGERVGCTATTRLHREHFTLNWQKMAAKGIAVIGPTLDIILDVQAIREG
jgi:polyisoprenoid-binding protein YceI